VALLQIRKLSKFYRDVRALSDVSLTVRRGEFVAVIGRSGSGKSTLMRCINRMVEPSAGEIFFDDVDVCKLPRRRLRRLRSGIGMIFQHYNLVHRLTVIENVLHGRLGHKSSVDGILGRYTEEEKRRAVKVIERLGLEEQVYKRCDTLSGGQKQRVGIARALVQEPKLILCDEPIASLDPSSAKVIMDELRDINRDTDITIIVNLHQVDVAAKYARRVVGINAGCVVFDDSAEKLTRKTINAIYGTDHGELVTD
jgi:phosphonate transport system ATP-binding protein